MTDLKTLHCYKGIESYDCRLQEAQERLAPALITDDIVNQTPGKYQSLYSRESWLYFWNTRFGEASRGVADLMFHQLDRYDGMANDGFLDISAVSEKNIEQSFKKLHTNDGKEAEILSAMEKNLTTYREYWVKKYYLVGAEGQLEAADRYGNVFDVDNPALRSAWAKLKEKYPSERVVRLVTDHQMYMGRKADDLNPDRQGILSAIEYGANIAVTGGVGLFETDKPMEFSPYSNRLSMAGFGPGFSDVFGEVVTVASAALLVLAALRGGRGVGGPTPTHMVAMPNQSQLAVGQAAVPRINTNLSSEAASAIEKAIKEDEMGRRNMPTIFMADSTLNKERVTSVTNDRELICKKMESFLNREELERLSDEELTILRRNVGFGEDLNNRFCRSRYYPLPRDLSFPSEKPLFQKWASGRQNLVEIGVFEGASSLYFRAAMSANGTLHLIDPYVKIPDSRLTARPWMARLSLWFSNNGRVHWYRDYSYNVVKDWTKPVDFLFIDGDHSESATRDDWLSWYSFVTAGGVALFHDARFGMGNGTSWDGWPGPTKVVDQIFRGPNKLPNWEIVDEAGSLVVVKRVY